MSSEQLHYHKFYLVSHNQQHYHKCIHVQSMMVTFGI